MTNCSTRTAGSQGILGGYSCQQIPWYFKMFLHLPAAGELFEPRSNMKSYAQLGKGI